MSHRNENCGVMTPTLDGQNTTCPSFGSFNSLNGVVIRFFFMGVVAASSLLPYEANAATCTSNILRAFSAEHLDCQCGETLKNIQITLPSSLQLVGACNLRWPSNNKPINLDKTKITLDRDTNGWIPQGYVLLEGHLKLPGELRVEEGPAGKYWFYPNPPIIAQKTPLSSELSMLAFGDDPAFQKLRIPRRFLHNNCFTADAILDVTNIHLLIGQTDEAGASPVRYRILKVNNFRRCRD